MATLRPLPAATEPIAGPGGKVSPRWRTWLQQAIDASTNNSGQVPFPAVQNPSADPNTLDDYEEGTFTPTIAFGGASVSVVYGTQTGVYTKIGNLVFFNIALSITNNGSSTGDATIGTLPFTPAVNVALFGRPSNYTLGAGLIPVFDTNGTTIRLRTFNPTTGNIAEAQDTQVDNDFSILISGAYRV